MFRQQKSSSSQPRQKRRIISHSRHYTTNNIVRSRSSKNHPYSRLSQRRQMSTTANIMNLDSFAERQFKKTDDKSMTTIDYDPQAFIDRVNEIVNQRISSGENVLVDGYAPFCKHIFIENFTTAKPASIPITDDNRSMIETAYSARTDAELPVLSRFIAKEKIGVDNIPPAKYLDLILYSREQICIETETKLDDENTPKEPWGLISIKPQNEAHETPMNPITMMRNALGTHEGGSGVPLEKEKYIASVKYWDQHVSIV